MGEISFGSGTAVAGSDTLAEPQGDELTGGSVEELFAAIEGSERFFRRVGTSAIVGIVDDELRTLCHSGPVVTEEIENIT